MVYRKTKGDYLFQMLTIVVIAFVVVVTLYPLVYVFSMSISDPHRALRGDVVLLPKGFSTKAYEVVFANKDLGRFYYNTVWYTVVGTLMNIVVTVLAAYPLSKTHFRMRKFFMVMFTFTMFFSGGLIPNYLVVTRLGLYNTRWAIILPVLTSAYYIIIARTFFQGLPEELFECARLEGAGEWRVLLQIAIPLSKPIIAVLAIYYAVGHWNSYFSAMLYLGKQELHPIQIYLQRVVIQSSPEAMKNFDMSAIGSGILSMMQVKYAVIIVALLPVIVMYPFLQKYFVQGMMIGSLKD